jgi:hypothetical protein
MRRLERHVDSSNKTLWIVLAIVGGVVVVCGGLITVAVVAVVLFGRSGTFHGTAEEIDAEQAAEEFLAEIDASGADAAYDLTSRGFQRRQSRLQFRSFIDRHPGLKGHQSVETDSNFFSSAPNKITVRGTVVTWNGSQLRVTLQMIKEDGEWKVDDFTIP